MKALIVGYGKMGTLIHKIAPHFDITVTALCDHNFSKHALLKKDGIRRSKNLTCDLLKGIDIAIDFSADTARALPQIPSPVTGPPSSSSRAA